MFKRLLSYLIPMSVFQKKSSISKNLEINWNNGKLVLDSLNTNYSYGSLQKILRKGLLHIGIENIIQMKQILLLGVAGGSVVKTLVEEFNYKGYITGIEIDPNVIDIANEYFELNKVKNYNTIITDASKFVHHNIKTYDLIIIDIFEDTKMPHFLFEKKFIDNCKRLLNVNGFILFNTMTLDEASFLRNNLFIQQFENNKYHCKTFSKIENYNQLIIIQKIKN